jgi:ABC-type nitrate/sulfonate/bicarbonate transport system permease component
MAWQHTFVSLQHISLGFCLATLIGILLGIAMSQSSVISALLMPVVDAVRPVAALTIFPLLILVLGLGLWSKVFVIFWTAWPPVLLSTVQSIRQVDRSLCEAAQLDGAGRWSRLWWVVLPLASPGILTGLRIGMSAGWISLVAAEMLGASRGLGYTVLTSSQTFQFATMYATIILIALIGLAMNSVLAWMQHMVEEKACMW